MGEGRRSLRDALGYSRLGARLLSFAVPVLVLFAGCAPSAGPPPIPTLPPPTSPTTAVPSPGPVTTSIPDPTDPGTETPEDTSVHVAPEDDLGTIAANAPEGTRFVLDPGTHRTQQVVPKDGQIFEGADGAVMNGAIVLTGWRPEGDGLWRFDGVSPSVFDHGQCIDGYEGCSLTQDLFMDGVTLWQVTTRDDLVPGTWFWEGESIHIADDPQPRRVELSVAVHAFAGSADDVTIRNLVVEKYAAPAQFGAIQASDDAGAPGSGWLIEDVEARLNHGAGIRLGERTTLRRVYVHHNGQLGIAGSGGEGHLVEDSTIESNNIAGFLWEWEGGGAKFTNTTDLVVRRNTVRKNTGPGLWTDIGNRDSLYEDNVVTDNTGPGIFHEISYAAQILGNTVTGNGFGKDRWLWGAGILVAASSDVEIAGNTVTGNADAIAGIQQDRSDDSGTPYLLRNLDVHDNVISIGGGQMGVVTDNGDTAVFDPGVNVFHTNSYSDAAGTPYRWDGRNLSRAGWQQRGQDIDGVWR